jgi:antitoxin component YwqK of YwqJK toxin-antitoxin module
MKATYLKICMAASLLLLIMSCSPGVSNQQGTDPTVQEKGKRDYSEIYDNGQVKINGTLVDGKRHGLWVSYFENGLKWSEENYYMGVRDGKAISYFSNGMLRYRGAYVDDVKAGLWTFYDEEGKVVKEVDFNEK